MQIISSNLNIDFLGKRHIAIALSLILMVASIVGLAVRGLNFGLDFTGGTLIELGYPEAADLSSVRAALVEHGLEDAVVQHFGTTRDVLIRIPPQDSLGKADLSTRVIEVLQNASDGKLEMRRVEFVGPQVGDELREDGGLAMLFALIGVLIYVALRFEFRFALGSVAALVHDVIVTLGFFAYSGMDFDLTVVAAILAVIGYSLNDTIVVFDRIRENFRIIRKGSPQTIINISLNQTLSRTLITSLTTLLVLVVLMLVGGELIHGFATALTIGVVVGTYSSVYVASATALALGVSKADLMPLKKEGADQEQGVSG